jgi:hypothetical protein
MAERNTWNNTDVKRWDNEGGRVECEQESRGALPSSYTEAGEPHGREYTESGQGVWGTYANRPSMEPNQWGKSAGIHHQYGGPASYAAAASVILRRPDDRIRDDVVDRLTEHPYIDASEVAVEVHGGEVTIAGIVENRRAKRIVDDLAEGVSGVKRVRDLLAVRNEQPESAAAY